MPITPQEAYDLTNPEATEDERKQAAQNIMAGVAANDAYYNSRSPLEQILARAAGGQHPPSHDDLNSTDSPDQLPGHDAEGTAEEISAPTPGAAQLSGPATVDPETAEVANLRAELEQLRAQVAENRGADA